MPNLNKVFLIGHIVRDPEIRYTPSGTAVLDFTIATNTHRKDQDDEVYFAAVTAFGSQAEAIAKYTKKGDPIFIEGRLKRDVWENKEGKKQEKTKIILNNFQFLKGKKGTQENPEFEEEQGDGIPF